jgi:DNA-binding NtrC family response regulator
MTEPHGDGTADKSGTAKKPVLLVVEEEDSVRHLLELALGRQGFNVLGARSGTHALSIYRKQGSDIDLVLVDVRMDGLSGPETVSKLREINPDVRCCFMSGDTALNKADELLECGVLHIFRKPFLSLVEFANMLRKFVKP